MIKKFWQLKTTVCKVPNSSFHKEKLKFLTKKNETTLDTIFRI